MSLRKSRTQIILLRLTGAQASENNKINADRNREEQNITSTSTSERASTTQHIDLSSDEEQD
jgi:hypothetical protein